MKRASVFFTRSRACAQRTARPFTALAYARERACFTPPPLLLPVHARWAASSVLHTPLSIAALHTCARHASTQSATASHHKSQDSGKDQQTSSSSTSSASASSFFETYRRYRQKRQRQQHVQYQTLSLYLDRLPPVLRELLLYSPLLALLYFVLVEARVYYRDEDESWYMVLVPDRWRYNTADTATNAASSNDTTVKGKDGRSEAPAQGTVPPTAHVSSLLKRAPPAEPILSSKLEEMAVALDVVSNTTHTVNKISVSHDHVHVESSKVNAAENLDQKERENLDLAVECRIRSTYTYRATDLHDAAAATGSVAPPLVAPFHAVMVRDVECDDSYSSPSSSSKNSTMPKEVRRSQTCEWESTAKALAQRHPYGVWEGPLQVLRDPTTNCVIGYATTAPA